MPLFTSGGLDLVSSGLDLVNLVLILVLRICEYGLVYNHWQ